MKRKSRGKGRPSDGGQKRYEKGAVRYGASEKAEAPSPKRAAVGSPVVAPVAAAPLRGPEGFLKRTGLAGDARGPAPRAGGGERRRDDRRTDERRRDERRSDSASPRSGQAPVEPRRSGKPETRHEKARPGGGKDRKGYGKQMPSYDDFARGPEKPAFGRSEASRVPPSRGRSGAKKNGPGMVLVRGEVQKNAKGFGFLLHKPEDIFIPREFATKLLTGDVVEVQYQPRSRSILSLDIVKRSISQFIGTYEANFDQRVVVLADRTMREDVQIKERPNIDGLRHGDKVQVEITRYEPKLEGRITRSFGAALAPKFDTLAVVVRSQWPQEFSAEAQSQAAKLSDEIQAKAAESGYKGRKDFREKPFVTIDGKDARDFDDAVLVEKTPSGFVLYVAIADVSEFVRPGMKLDDEAYARATSVYFPEWVIPMLPEALSNGACSLRPDEEKLTLCCEMHFDLSGKKRSAKVYEAVIRSHRRCTYEDVHKEWKAGENFWTAPFELYQLIRVSRNKRGSLDLDLPEAKIVLDENSDTIDIIKVERLDSHRLIEEFMIAANESVTETMEREGWPFIYRVHEPPKVEALERFERFAMALGLKPKLSGSTDPKLFARFIDTLKEHPFATTLYYLMLRSLKQARYDSTNLKHFGLASQAYTHFTSPIRRYPDLMVHRILKRYVRREVFNEEQDAEFAEYLLDACDHCSKQERKAEDLDRTVIKVKKARFMAKHIGEKFQARITNVTENGLFVELARWFVDGLVPIDELGGDYFEFIEERMMLKGKRTGKKYKIGDTLEVAVLRADVDNGFVDFTLADALGDDAEAGDEDDDTLDAD